MRTVTPFDLLTMSGLGLVSSLPTLAEYFQHVHVSDISPEFVGEARKKLDDWFERRFWKPRFTFSVTAAEKAHKVVAKRSVDLIALLQCAHWTDQDAMIRSTAASLVPMVHLRL